VTEKKGEDVVCAFSERPSPCGDCTLCQLRAALARAERAEVDAKQLRAALHCPGSGYGATHRCIRCDGEVTL
jgi:hypothetical protein